MLSPPTLSLLLQLVLGLRTAIPFLPNLLWFAGEPMWPEAGPRRRAASGDEAWGW